MEYLLVNYFVVNRFKVLRFFVSESEDEPGSFLIVTSHNNDLVKKIALDVLNSDDDDIVAADSGDGVLKIQYLYIGENKIPLTIPMTRKVAEEKLRLIAILFSTLDKNDRIIIKIHSTR